MSSVPQFAVAAASLIASGVREFKTLGMGSAECASGNCGRKCAIYIVYRAEAAWWAVVRKILTQPVRIKFCDGTVFAKIEGNAETVALNMQAVRQLLIGAAGCDTTSVGDAIRSPGNLTHGRATEPGVKKGGKSLRHTQLIRVNESQ